MSVPIHARLHLRRLPVASFGGIVPMSPVSVLARWYDRYLQRRALAELDDRMLRDVGLTRGDVERELRKPVWR